MNYLQLINLINITDLKISIYIQNYMEFLGVITSTSSKLMAFECVFQSLNKKISLSYLKFYCQNIIDAILFFSSIFIWTLIKKFQKINEINYKIYATIIGIYVMILPNIVNESIKIMTCIELDSHEKYIEGDPKVSCSNDEYKKINNLINIPIFVVWSAFVPGIILLG